MKLLLAFLALLVLGVTSQSKAGLRVYSAEKVGRVDTATGVVTCDTPLGLPSPAPGCHWNRGTGTRGQTSAIFYINMTFFFVAQEVCGENKIGRTTLFATEGPFPCHGKPPAGFHVYAMGQLNLTSDFENSNLAWDHTCNVVLISPDVSTAQQETFVTNQISEFDGQQRIQIPTSEQGSDCDDCWRRVPGLGALDFGDFEASWPVGKELNCGDTCLFYTIQEHIVKGTPTGERKLVGTSFRTGQVGLEIPDPIQAKTLSWNPFAEETGRVNQFLGIGVCCDGAGCLPECKSHVGDLVLFAFSPQSKSITFLADIGPMDSQTIQVGIEYSPAPQWNAVAAEAYVLHQNTIVTFSLKLAQKTGVVMAAEKVSQSPPLTWDPILMWANAGY